MSHVDKLMARLERMETTTYPRTPIDNLLSGLDGIVMHSHQSDVRQDLHQALMEFRKEVGLCMTCGKPTKSGSVCNECCE